MNEIREWSFEGNGIRTVEIDGEPWWVLKEVCGVLGLTAKHIPERLDEDEVKQIHLTDTLGRSQKTNIINESGLYAVILRSDKPQAKAFRKWITAEVLPAIRRTGGYQKPDSYMIEDRVERAKRWIEEEHERKSLRQQLAEQEPKVLLAEAITASPGCILIGELAKLLRQNGVETGQRRLFKWMRDNEWLCSGKAEHNHPTQRAIERGYMVLQERILHIEGREVSRFTPMITGAGQEFFINLLIGKK